MQPWVWLDSSLQLRDLQLFHRQWGGEVDFFPEFGVVSSQKRFICSGIKYT